MNSFDERSNPFIKQMSKLFEDLGAGQKEKQAPVSPRITCTRLRRLREIRCELVEVSEPNLNTIGQSELEDTVAQLNSVRNKNESFASWVLRNKQTRQFADTKNQRRGQISSDSVSEKNVGDNANAFANFSPSALRSVAKNLNTPPSTLKWLASNCKSEIRQLVAGNKNAGETVMSILVRDVDENVRIILAGNVSLSRDLLLKLCDDPSPLVSEKAKNVLYEQSKSAMMNKQTFAEVQNSGENAICEAKPATNGHDKNKAESALIEREFLQVIAERSTTPPRRLAELAAHSDKFIRCTVATNPNATPEILWQLAKDKSIDVRKRLLSNYNCPKEIIDYLMCK